MPAKRKQRPIYFTDEEWEQIGIAVINKDAKSKNEYARDKVLKAAKRDSKG